MRKIYFILFTALCFGLGIFQSQLLRAETIEEPKFLFNLVDTLKSESSASPAAVQEQQIRFNSDSLNLEFTKRLRIPLLDGNQYDALRSDFNGFERFSSDEFTWRGKISEENNWSGDVILTFKDRAVSGLIYSPNGVYEIITQENFNHILVEIDQSKFPKCGESLTPIKINSKSEDILKKQESTIPSKPFTEDLFNTSDNKFSLFSESESSLAVDNGSIIDVMIAYTSAVRNSLGGTTQVQAFAQQSIASANTAYQNSGVTTRLRLVQTMEVDYADNGDGEDGLKWVSSNSTVATARNNAKADLVSMLTENATDVCGIAYRMTSLNTSFASSAFSLVQRACAVSNLSFAHELGHNQSLDHNPENSNNSSPHIYPYGYGHQQDGLFSTVMAYNKPNNPACTALNGCPRIPYFSNPNISWGGVSTGITNQRENFRALNNTALTVSQFRDSGGSGCNTYTINPNSVSITASGGNGSVSVTASSGCPWTATSNANWISVSSGSSGNGSGIVTYSVQANTATSTRTGTLTIAGQTFTVNQAAGSSGCAVTPIRIGQTINGSLANCVYTGTSRYVDLYSFSATAGQQIAISMNSTFDTQLYLYDSAGTLIAENDDIVSGNSNSRIPAPSGYITLQTTGNFIIYATSYYSNSTGAYTISLLGNCNNAINPTSANATAGGGNGSVIVTALPGCAWSATSNVSWITVTSGAAGSGNGTVGFSVAVNTATSARTGTLTIAGQTFTVNQAAGCTYTLNPTSANMTGSGGSGSTAMITSTGCQWAAASNASWITLTSGFNGLGNGIIGYSVQANSSNARTGTITIGGQTFTVNQAAGSTGCPATGISAGQTINASLSTSDCTLQNRGYVDVYSFNGIAGQQIAISMNSSFDTYLYLANSSNTILAENDDIVLNTNRNSRIPITGFFTLQSTGTFYIWATSYAENTTGSYSLTLQTNNIIRSQFDFDGDGRADISVFRPSNAEWYLDRSTLGFGGLKWGQQGDLMTPADYDGDGRTDIAVFRAGFWYRLNSSNNQFVSEQFGSLGDIPVPGDFDGDGRADIAVFRPSNGFWYWLNSSNGQFSAFKWGVFGDKPQIGDFDADKRTDLAVFRPSEATWYILLSSNNQFFGVRFGIPTDVPTIADYDGDGRTDISVYRPSAGSWYRINSSTQQFFYQQFGISEDKPAPADYDGDGRADIAVFRPSSGTWYLQRSTAGFTGQKFGISNDIPIPTAFGR